MKLSRPLPVLLVVVLLAGCTAGAEEPPTPASPAPTKPGASAHALPPASSADPQQRPSPTAEPSPAATDVVGGESAVIVAGGRIGRCRLTIDERTAAIVEQIDGIIATLGDHAYPDGTAGQFARCYDPTWGRFKDRTYPVAGNHDYHTPGGRGYYRYFGERAGTPGEGWYTYEAGTWRVYALNSECPHVGGCEPGSAQYEWLRGQLAEHPAHCVLAYWHRPVFSSGSDGGQPWMASILDLLYESAVDLVLTGDDHLYERLAPSDGRGRPDPDRGVRQINVGTAGSPLHEYGGPPLTITEVRDNTTNGVLKLDLHPGGYEWEFLPVEPDGFTDSGADTCR